MKKIMIALTAVAMIGIANAATYKWENSYGVNAYGKDAASEDLASGTIYLMDSSTISQSAFIAAVLGAEDKYATEFAKQVASAVNSATLTTDPSLTSPSLGKVDGSGILVSDVEATERTYYQVMIDTANNGVFISEEITFTPAGTGAQSVDFANDGAYANAAFGSDITSFKGDGWYTAVPEPTSGLLMLVGLAGLALRRRRA